MFWDHVRIPFLRAITLHLLVYSRKFSSDNNARIWGPLRLRVVTFYVCNIFEARAVIWHNAADENSRQLVDDKCILLREISQFRLIFTEIRFKGSNEKYTRVGSDNGLAANK